MGEKFVGVNTFDSKRKKIIGDLHNPRATSNVHFHIWELIGMLHPVVKLSFQGLKLLRSQLWDLRRVLQMERTLRYPSLSLLELSRIWYAFPDIFILCQEDILLHIYIFHDDWLKLCFRPMHIIRGKIEASG